MADVTSPFGFPYPEDTDLVRDGAQDIENLATGVNDYLAGGYLFAGQIRYTSSGNFIKADPFGTGDIGLRAIRVRMVGGGGGGGGAATTGAGEAAVGCGGGGGAYAESFITDIAGLDASVVVTRGAGGTGGAAGANAGDTGGISSFGALVSATGGNGGFGSGAFTPAVTFLAAGGATSGGATATGDFISAGGRSGVPAAVLVGAAVVGSHGGDSLLGLARSVPAGTGQNGVVGDSSGAGGSGGSNGPSQGTARSGGAGANGIVIVDCFV